MNAQYSLALNRLLVNFEGDIASLGTLNPADWTVESAASERYSNPSSWSIVGGNQLRLEGFSSTFAATFTNRFRKTGTAPINFANGSTIGSIDWTSVSFIA